MLTSAHILSSTQRIKLTLAFLIPYDIRCNEKGPPRLTQMTPQSSRETHWPSQASSEGIHTTLCVERKKDHHSKFGMIGTTLDNDTDSRERESGDSYWIYRTTKSCEGDRYQQAHSYAPHK